MIKVEEVIEKSEEIQEIKVEVTKEAVSKSIELEDNTEIKKEEPLQHKSARGNQQ